MLGNLKDLVTNRHHLWFGVKSFKSKSQIKFNRVSTFISINSEVNNLIPAAKYLKTNSEHNFSPHGFCQQLAAKCEKVPWSPYQLLTYEGDRDFITQNKIKIFTGLKACEICCNWLLVQWNENFSGNSASPNKMGKMRKTLQKESIISKGEENGAKNDMKDALFTDSE